MAYPTIKILRKAKLEKPMGIGEGRITEGVLGPADWTTSRTIKAGSLGLRSLTNIHLTCGTIMDLSAGSFILYGSVNTRGSIDNSVLVRASGSVRLNYVAVGY